MGFYLLDARLWKIKSDCPNLMEQSQPLNARLDATADSNANGTPMESRKLTLEISLKQLPGTYIECEGEDIGFEDAVCVIGRAVRLMPIHQPMRNAGTTQ